MTRPAAIGLAIIFMTIAFLNVIDLLPDWTTLTAILAVPFIVTADRRRCRHAGK